VPRTSPPLHENASEPVVLALADADDPAVARLVSRLSGRLPVSWWRFGLPETSITVDVDEHGFRLEQAGAVLSSRQLQSARVIVYRRRFLEPRPLVRSDLESCEERAFSEREWTSLIDGLLLAEERRSRSVWLNSPSATVLTNNKLSLLLSAARAGLPVPPFSVSTPVRFPITSRPGLVTKAVSADERIDSDRFFSTAVLSDEDLRDLPGALVPTPPLLQELVPATAELRVFYALGEVLALALTPSRTHVDIRHAAREELAPRPYDLPADLRSGLADLARAFRLKYCTFDLVVPTDGPPALVDVTPNGDWDWFESEAAPTVTDFIADVIVRAAR
jgi:hypothetical protein